MGVLFLSFARGNELIFVALRGQIRCQTTRVTLECTAIEKIGRGAIVSVGRASA
jgi:hypothetical protein